MAKDKMLPKGSDWTFDKIEQYTQVIDKIAREDFRLETYPNQIEVITADQMLDAYASHGIPVGYKHWSYGKRLISDQKKYRRGQMGLAYEIVINSKPCIAYLMEENTMPMQALVIAHACYGHNAVFKNNYLFQERTDAAGIIDYMLHAQKFIKEQEDKHGPDVVEDFLDCCHSLSMFGFDHYPRAIEKTKSELDKQRQERLDYKQSQVNEFWDTLIPRARNDFNLKKKYQLPKEPEENVLRFIEKHAPNLEDWQREIIRIVRNIEEYFYPQRQTQVLNEGFATFTHYNIINKMFDDGYVDEGFMLELLQSHNGVINQLPFDHPYYSGINVYALGFAMFQDIRRMCENPTEEDKRWFPELVGKDWIEETQRAAFDHTDETFILQYLSPKVIRDMKLFTMSQRRELENHYEVSEIHNDEGYREVRKTLASSKNFLNRIPHIQVKKVDVFGDRTLSLEHHMSNGVRLDKDTTVKTLKCVQKLWGFDVVLRSLDNYVIMDEYRTKKKQHSLKLSGGNFTPF